MRLRVEYVHAVDKVCRIAYVNGEITKYFNARRKDSSEPCILSGWFWVSGGREGGPFKSLSACYRDAYFRQVLKITPPRTPLEIPPQRAARRAAARIGVDA